MHFKYKAEALRLREQNAALEARLAALRGQNAEDVYKRQYPTRAGVNQPD